MNPLGRAAADALAACVVAGVLPAGAEADASSPSRAHPGGSVSFTVPVEGARSCTVRADGRSTSADVADAARVRVAFRVARRARTGAWSLSVACTPGPTRRFALVVVGAKRSGGSHGRLVGSAIRIQVSARVPVAALPSPAVVSAPPVAGPLSEADALTRARADWTTYGPAYLAVFRNGQCTDWAAQKRPDLVEQATVRLWADHLMGRPDLGITWNGGDWDDMARAARLPVRTIPAAVTAQGGITFVY